MAAQSQFSVWHYKPWWCQPWSILLTGFGAIAASWLLFHRYWVMGAIAVPMLAWMGFFLLLYPRLMAQAQAELSETSSSPDSLPKV